MRLSRLLGVQRRLSGFINHFVVHPLPEVLKSIGQPPAVKIEPIGSGRNALVRGLLLADGRSLVLRAYFADPKKQHGYSHWYLSRYLAERGLRVPAIHFRGVFPFRRGKADVEILIEDLVEGQVINEAMRESEMVRRRVVETILQIHKDQAPRPGYPWLDKESADPLHEEMAKAPARFKRIRAQLAEVTDRQVNQCLMWLKENLARRSVPRSYELTHGDFNRENVLLTPDGEIVLVDLVSMAYGCFEADLVDVRWMFFDQAWWEGFCDEYFAAEPLRRERFEKNAPLFFAFFYLTKSSRHASSAGKASRKHDQETTESHLTKSRRFWNLLLGAVDGEPLRPDLSFPIDDD